MKMRKYRYVIAFLVVCILGSSFLSYDLYKKVCVLQGEINKFEFVKLSKLQSCIDDNKKQRFFEFGGEYIPDYITPRTLNDKVVYLLRNYFDKSPITTIIGTKYLAKKYIANIVGEQHNVKLFGVWDKPEDIVWDDLPNSFVLKTVRGHYGKQVVVVKDKSKLNREKVIEQLNKLSDDIFRRFNNGDYPNKNRFIAEELLVPENSDMLIDYKFLFSYGKPIVAYCFGISCNTDNRDVKFKKCSCYSLPDWRELPITVKSYEKLRTPSPKNMSKMLEIASKLSKPFPLIRIDMYEIGGRVLVGEITEDHAGGASMINPAIWDFMIGLNISIPDQDEIERMIEIDKKIYEEYMQLYM